MAREVALMMMGRASSSASSSSSSSCRVSWRLTAMASAAKEVSSLALLFLQGRHGLRGAWGAGGGQGQISACPSSHAGCARLVRHQKCSPNPKRQGCPDTESWQSPQKAEGMDNSAEEWSQGSGGWGVPQGNPHSPLQDDGGWQGVVRGTLQQNAASQSQDCADRYSPPWLLGAESREGTSTLTPCTQGCSRTWAALSRFLASLTSSLEMRSLAPKEMCAQSLSGNSYFPSWMLSKSMF